MTDTVPTATVIAPSTTASATAAIVAVADLVRIALVAVLAFLVTAAPVAATHASAEADAPALWGNYTNSALADSDGDGVLDLTMCFKGTTMYNGRASLAAGVRIWSRAIQIEFISTGRCDTGDTSNMIFELRDLGYACLDRSGQSTGGSAHSQATISFNSRCSWSWTKSGGTGGHISAMTYATHESGHALGLHHEQFNGANGHYDIMDNPVPCSYEYARSLSENDARSMRARYTGIPRTSTVFANSLSCSAT